MRRADQDVANSIVYIARLEHILGRFALPLKAVALDAGYFTTEIANALIERKYPASLRWKKRMFRRKSFNYASKEDVYIYLAK